MRSETAPKDTLSDRSGTSGSENGPGPRLMRTAKARAAALAAVFALGIIAMDRVVYALGDYLVASGAWKDNLLPMLARVPDQDIYLLGGCRAALNFDSKRIGESLGKKVFNGAVVADGMGNIDFALSVLLSHHAAGTVVFVIDDGNWEETPGTIRPEIDRRLIWWGLLDERSRRELASTYHLSAPLLRSGFWKFKGTGPTFAKALARCAIGKFPALGKDGYTPRPSEQNLIPNLARETELLAGMRKSFRPSPFARARIESFIRRAQEGGLKPILVVAPMHRFRSTDEINQVQRDSIQALAGRMGIPFLSYLDNHGELANRDSAWSDIGHMNRLGAEAFSDRFANDMRAVLGSRP